MEVELEVDDGVALMTLNAPERRNALTPQMAREMVDALERVDADDGIGALVIRGADGRFCAGAHTGTLDGAGADPSDDATYTGLSVIYESFTRVGAVKAFTIAAVRGAAVGAGMNLALAADMRVVSRDARLLSGFLRIGLHPGGGHFVLLSRLAGREAAAAMALAGAEIDGDRAVALGLAWEAHGDDEVEARAMDFARGIAKDPALARAAVRSFRMETGPPGVGWDMAVQTERAPQMWSMRRRSGGRP
ncbi:MULTISPECIES: enoyl-CoA hydratase-related protein [unclassified Pseudonocardia]|uniref:enoyl-CoA hydratase-related protein n=1 Tax=unclassified Pseudonocardia TaxID=2619320 RepID=UPI000A7F7222|nr:MULTISPECIES: enoyl-CoA hydratase-related protein [unclassified Pseudonocardia]